MYTPANGFPPHEQRYHTLFHLQYQTPFFMMGYHHKEFTTRKLIRLETTLASILY